MKLCLNFGFNSGDSESMFWCATMQQDQLRPVKKQLRLIIIIILLQPSQRERVWIKSCMHRWKIVPFNHLGTSFKLKNSFFRFFNFRTSLASSLRRTTDCTTRIGSSNERSNYSKLSRVNWWANRPLVQFRLFRIGNSLSRITTKQKQLEVCKIEFKQVSKTS